ncbi:MAG: hypothetical protein JW776_10220 [Candidatus Lokiarchaeota archaeon]|nr:hypothetical protein [Candidatus Lokiarchaeota archaeon]
MATWRDILNFEVVKDFVKKLSGVEMDEELREKGFLELENKYSDSKIYEMEATEIEQELIKIYLDLLQQKGVKIRKKIRIPVSMNDIPLTPDMMDFQDIKRFLREYPELRQILEEILDEEDDEDYESEDDDSYRDMYI